MNRIQSVNQVVAVGSVDGILASAALLRLIGNPNVDIVFTQAFAVDKIDIGSWTPGRTVAFVDLAVNNRDKSMTAKFVHELKAAGHQLVAVCDEHDRDDWLEVLGNFDGLFIEPRSQSAGIFKSSGAILRNFAGDDLDAHGKMLCDVADAGDRMVFEGIGALVNQAVKSKIQDDTRRSYLAWHFAFNTEADAKIQEWINEYEAILQNHEAILAEKQELGNGIVRVCTIGKVVDVTTLMSQLYKAGTKVVVLEAEMFDKVVGCKTRQISFGTSEKIDLLACIKKVVPTASGFAQKVNVAPELEDVALKAVRALLS